MATHTGQDRQEPQHSQDLQHTHHPDIAGGRLFCRSALLPEGWRSDVLLRWNADGDLIEATPGSARGDAPLAAGPVIPGMPNLHSHAFQRAMAGLTETMGSPTDSFWSWRTLMYRFAQRLQPQHLEAIARHLYIEMLKAGYTSVCEFHYLHHALGGAGYDDPAELSLRVMQAAQDAGLGMTLLPVLYQYGGFGAAAPLEHQARFISSPQWMLALRERLQKALPENGMRRYGVAPHSLRAVDAAGLAALVDGLRSQPGGADAPIHIHIAEQTREVDDCLAWCGKRPVQLLLSQQELDARWCLVHATHMSDDEYRAVAQSGAVVGLCPTTEANLGDGIIDAPRLLDDGANWGIGSDSNIAINLRSELRLLEYGQRLHHRRRNMLASQTQPAVADRLFAQAVSGGALASGRRVAGIAAGQRADFVVLDAQHINLADRAPEQLLSALVFCEHEGNPVRDVYVGGRKVVSEGRHALEEGARAAYRATVSELLKD
ncbi:formimidoylglutamate deiminase [Herbaspirillum robiniae]|uniref:Formimidoylglutamate deiminase n=1 Tax=Herbaspirillum robiniae TaxID=2014887 RepID=A0ABX2LRX3_9BURK|nr:formimidoylglutamate deiminase [Herbaspirillum robiniae]NUU01297.1 formimidoylglutamate deiminase [Herbaspirillum robiniae]